MKFGQTDLFHRFALHGGETFSVKEESVKIHNILV